jgi:hypothetical protein
MYLRFSTLIDLCAQIIQINSRQALAEQLGVGVSTLNAYRSGTRFPEPGPASSIRNNIHKLLYKAILLTKDSTLKNFDCEAYVLSTLNIEKHFRCLNNNFYLGNIENLASQISFLVFSEANKQKIDYSYNDAKSVLILLLRQEASIFSLSVICKWIFDSYIKYASSNNSIKAHSFSSSHPISSISDFIDLYKNNNNINITAPQAWDLILTCIDSTSLTTSFCEKNQMKAELH